MLEKPVNPQKQHRPIDLNPALHPFALADVSPRLGCFAVLLAMDKSYDRFTIIARKTILSIYPLVCPTSHKTACYPQPMKPTRTAAQLKQMLQERVAALPGLSGLTDVDLGGVVWREAGEGAANWTVPTLRSRDDYKTSIAQVIRQMQELYDLEE